MATTLLEISQSLLFIEYLRHAGIRPPQRHQDWEYRIGAEVLARIRCLQGQPRYFIAAQLMSKRAPN